MSDIALSSATRLNILSLQRTQTSVDATQTRLSTGLKVNSAIDDAVAFFTARNLNSRASDLSVIKDTISSGVGVVTTAVQGLEAIEELLQQMQALAQSAISATDADTRAKLASQFNELRSQVDNIAEDASFDGINLLKNGTGAFVGGADELTVTFNEQTEAAALNQVVVEGLAAAVYQDIVGTAAVATGVLGNTTVWGQTGTAAVTAINAAITALDSALTTLRTSAQQFGNNASLLQVRMDFTQNMINSLSAGAAVLVNADLNEESANLLSLQTRQQLGTISLAIAQRSEQSIFRLF
jgi:flagellin-like hook-associated protein FlgL